MTTATGELGEILRSSFERFRTLPALWLGGEYCSYGQLFAAAVKTGAALLQDTDPGERVAILAQHSFPAYVGVLASILSGRPYVPINMKFPLERQLYIVSASNCSRIISDSYSKRRCGELLERVGSKLREVSVAPPEDNPPAVDFSGGEAKPGLAYVMFTSGTTGTPKGVAVRRDNVASYLQAIRKIVPLEPGTRCTQLFDLSFDLSVHDLLHTWASGGCLYVMGNEEALDPVGFAQQHGLQSWFSVPSVVAMARRLNRLMPAVLPEMQFSLFCGEPLPFSIAEEWSKVAPNSRLFNLYGPTEATIAITAQEFVPSQWGAGRPATVPLGEPFENCAALVVDEAGKPAMSGELWLGGAQISDGYVNNKEEDKKKFVEARLPGYSYERWYRTGDVVRTDEKYGLIFEGRIDHQVKIQGYRIELLEIEEVLRRASGSPEAAAVPWPLTESGSAEGVVAFVGTSAKTERQIIDFCRSLLPGYMTPRRIFFVDKLPLNANGKVDRNALRQMLAH
ncbi:MAG TPA: amino acid adenylation domain-containing protein [Rhizomicrobium sp.]|nr:amino acid adenylation domain-containing protein [Rhizomicrobium sp.]